MNKYDLSTMLARQTRLSRAQAADQVDRVVHGIIRSLQKGQTAQLPGLGSFRPGDKWQFRFDAAPRGKRAK